MKAQGTKNQYQTILEQCREVFSHKMIDYGAAWRLLRPASLTDQLLIKARRIREIQERGVQKVDDHIQDDFIGLVNYGIMALIQLRKKPVMAVEGESAESLLTEYDAAFAETRDLMERKNHDYGEVWREMRIASMTDLILMKLMRIKQIEDRNGQTLVSEGLEANYADIVNYAMFCLIKFHEANPNP